MNVSVNGAVYTEHTNVRIEIAGDAHKDAYRILSEIPGSRVHIEFGPGHKTVEDALRLRHMPIDDADVRVMYQPATEIKQITVTLSVSGPI